MLHDPKRDIPQLLTTERVAMWLETQPPEKEYDYFNNCDCLLARYFIDYGYENVFVTDQAIRINGKHYDFPDLQFNRIVWPTQAVEDTPKGQRIGTYGDALSRAKIFIEVNNMGVA